MTSTAWPPWTCPTHQRVLALERESLVCPAGHSFPVVRGIPRFVEGSTYAEAFGVQWKRYRLTQLDSYTGTTISTDRARRCLGESLWRALPGKHVLECGCGAGRFTEVLLGRGARVTSVDLSEAVEANEENFPQNDSHRIAQADIVRLPFPPRQFDVVFCLGVVQHTPSSEETIQVLYEQVRPGGSLVLDHYSRRFSWLASLSPLFRRRFRRLSAPEGLARTEQLVARLLPLHKRGKRFARLMSRLSPVASYYHMYPELSDHVHREWAMLDTHDALTDWHKHFRTHRQIRDALERLGSTVIWCEYGGNGVEARAIRPTALGR